MSTATSAKSRTNRYFPALTGLRALAAFGVFGHHFQQWFRDTPVLPWVRDGYIGVSIFFTLSGYLITRTYFDRLGNGQIGFGEYWFRRFARVWPVFAFLLTICLILQHTGPSLFQLFLNYTLMQGFFQTYVWSGIAPAWSLTVEECFYLSVPLVFTLLWQPKKPLAKYRPSRTFLILALFSAALWWLGNGLQMLNPGGDFMGNEQLGRIYNIFGRFPEFAFGVFAAIHLTGTPRATSRDSGFWKTIAPWLPEIAFVASFALAGVCLLLLVSLKDFSAGYNYGIVNPHGNYCLWVLSTGVCLLIWATVRGSRLSSMLLGNRVMEYLGRTSYIFYLLQERAFAMPIHTLLARLFPSLVGGAAYFAVMYVALNLVAAALHQCIEAPVHRWLISKIGSRRRSRVPARVAAATVRSPR